MKLTKEDVFGKFDSNYNRISNGMIVARSGDTCPIFKDKVPYKSETVICTIDQYPEVIYWLDYVNGGNSVSKEKQLNDDLIALRSDYKCW